MNEQKLKEIEAMCEKATPGPWWIAQSGYNCTGPRAVSHHNPTVEETQPLPIYAERNMEFIANSRIDIPTLIAALREAWEERDTYRSAYAALLYDEPLDNGEYVHVGTCNASRKKPVGNDMCSCPIGRRVKS